MKEFNKYFDSTLLKPEATPDQIHDLCEEALEYDFAAVCVNPCYVRLAASVLQGSKVKVATVVGFPLGASSPEVKAFEAKTALEDGADEIDMVINVGMLKAGNLDYVKTDIAAVVGATLDSTCDGTSIPLVKVILETCLLNDDEIKSACHLAEEAGAAFVKTSTGFNSGGATVEAVSLMKATLGNAMGIKAAGGIRDLATAEAMINAGADRLGCSACKAIMNEKAQDNI